jgi:hypothetical protein
MITWWDLENSDQTVESLHDSLRADDIKPWATVPGLCLKLWIADREHNRWGAVMLWESEAAPAQLMPPNRANELIGYPPAHRILVEAAAEGIHSLASEAGPGLELGN